MLQQNAPVTVDDWFWRTSGSRRKQNPKWMIEWHGLKMRFRRRLLSREQVNPRAYRHRNIRIRWLPILRDNHHLPKRRQTLCYLGKNGTSFMRLSAVTVPADSK